MIGVRSHQPPTWLRHHKSQQTQRPTAKVCTSPDIGHRFSALCSPPKPATKAMVETTTCHFFCVARCCYDYAVGGREPPGSQLSKYSPASTAKMLFFGHDLFPELPGCNYQMQEGSFLIHWPGLPTARGVADRAHSTFSRSRAPP